MGRRVATQVHHQISRLMLGGRMQTPPVWYRPVLAFPPLPLPAKAPPQRTTYDQKFKPLSKLRRLKNRPLPIYYLEDDLRRQFFTDHPFEAFRPTTLVEKSEVEVHPVNGANWTRLRQRGRNPSAEDAVQFAVNLHQNLDVPLSEAYARAVHQFRALRSEHHVATTYAAWEADQLGADFAPTEIEHAFEKEKRALASWEKLQDMDAGSLAARKRWRMIPEAHAGKSRWSRGVEYVKLWQAGVPVNYAPAITKAMDEVLDLPEAEEAEIAEALQPAPAPSDDLSYADDEFDDIEGDYAQIESSLPEIAEEKTRAGAQPAIMTHAQLQSLVQGYLGAESANEIDGALEAFDDLVKHTDSSREATPPVSEDKAGTEHITQAGDADFFNFTKSQ
ncbi:unnamed protein product [Mycena citricolor]|uniref:Small ribosomal subunit protein mS23 n=1 Tax=Mycena citricolor TaxID=2018698 RepID=A0AAD2K5H1_9AGAR|nr:unnamed protein product [Mycena citricolor]